MAIEYVIDNDRNVVCKFNNRMDTAVCIEVEQNLMNSIEGAASVVFDLSGVEYIASSFLRLCGKVSYKVNPDKFSIVKASPAVRKVFKIAGLTDKLNME